MSITLSSMRTAVVDGLLQLSSRSRPFSPTCCGRLTEPRLHTAISSLALVLRVISVHRLEECTTPVCCCGERMLQVSLKVIQGWPVSNSMPSILRHRSAAARSCAASAHRWRPSPRIPHSASRRQRRTGRAGRARRWVRTGSTRRRRTPAS